jgi:hypothetical protein
LYWEVKLGNAPYSPRGSNTSYNAFGFGLSTVFNSTTTSSSVTDAIILADNGYYKNFSGAFTDSGLTFVSGDVLSVAVDLTANTFTFYQNNSSVVTGTIGDTAGTTLTPFVLSYDGTYGVMDANFGQRPFTYTPPTGFVSLNTFNLPTSTIVKGNTVMDATTYTGNGGTLAVTNAGAFKPDLVWVKQRNTVRDNQLQDSVRGVALSLQSNTTSAESNFGLISSLNSNGFTVFTNGTYVASNENGGSFVGWQWQAGQGSTSSNTNGTITSTVSVNASAGFSVVTYTGTGANATVGHGLGVAPSMYIIKQRAGSTGNWGVYHKSIGANSALFLDLTDAATTASVWNNTAPTSSVFTIGAGSFVNGNGGTYVAYCWAPIAGYSAFGSVSTNGAADNAFVYTGFLPRFVLFKRTDSTSNWFIWDTARNTFNVFGNELYPNLSNAEASAVDLDILSNGFKLRSASFSGTWIYAAFATTPFKQSLGF